MPRQTNHAELAKLRRNLPCRRGHFQQQAASIPWRRRRHYPDERRKKPAGHHVAGGVLPSQDQFSPKLKPAVLAAVRASSFPINAGRERQQRSPPGAGGKFVDVPRGRQIPKPQTASVGCASDGRGGSSRIPEVHHFWRRCKWAAAGRGKPKGRRMPSGAGRGVASADRRLWRRYLTTGAWWALIPGLPLIEIGSLPESLGCNSPARRTRTLLGARTSEEFDLGPFRGYWAGWQESSRGA